jgi:hypothetical protein
LSRLVLQSLLSTLLSLSLLEEHGT